MRIRLTLFLLCANFILFGAILFLKQKSNSLSHSITPDLGIEASAFEALKLIQIETAHGVISRKLVKEGRDWKIISPIEWPANPFAVQRILTQLEFLERDISFPVSDIQAQGKTLADYGLETPILTIILKTDEEEWKLRLGQPHPQDQRLYLLSPDGEHILVVSKELLTSLLVESEDLRSPQLFSIPPFEIQGFALQISRPNATKIRLARTGEHWVFESPIHTDANERAVMTTLSSLCALPIVRFCSQQENAPTLTGLDNPSMRLSIEGFHRRETLLIGNRLQTSNKTPEYYAAIENLNSLFTLPADAIDRLQKAESQLRERHFVKFDPATLVILEIGSSNSPEKNILLEHLETGAWQIKSEKTSPLPADDVVIEELIQSFLNLEAVQFVSDAPSAADLEQWGLTNPTRTLLLKSNQNQLTLFFGKEEPTLGLIYVKTSNSPSIYSIDASFIQKLPQRTEYYRSRWIDPLPKNSLLQSIRLTNLANNQDLLFFAAKEKESAQSQLIQWQEEGLSKNIQPMVKTLLHDLTGFRVKEFLETPFESAFVKTNHGNQPWHYELEAVAFPTIEGESPLSTKLFFTERLNGTSQIGGAPSVNLNFNLTQDMIDALEAIIRPIDPPSKK